MVCEPTEASRREGRGLGVKVVVVAVVVGSRGRDVNGLTGWTSVRCNEPSLTALRLRRASPRSTDRWAFLRAQGEADEGKAAGVRVYETSMHGQEFSDPSSWLSTISSRARHIKYLRGGRS